MNMGLSHSAVKPLLNSVALSSCMSDCSHLTAEKSWGDLEDDVLVSAGFVVLIAALKFQTEDVLTR